MRSSSAGSAAALAALSPDPPDVMPGFPPVSLGAVAASCSQTIADPHATARWCDLASRHALGDVYGRTVLLCVASQWAAAAALLELDGRARRIVLCAPDLAPGHLPFVADASGAAVILRDARGQAPGHFEAEWLPARRNADEASMQSTETEWVLLTSGTTGRPKLVVHTLATLAGAISPGPAAAPQVVWSTFYDIRRFGGLQIFLRAALSGSSMVLSSAEEPVAEFLARAGAAGVTHISGTPSHWRAALMSPAAAAIAPRYVRLSGEIADQALLDQLKSRYPQAKLVHAFASTEAGLAFEVEDGRMGVPEQALGQGSLAETKIEGGTLRVRSNRTALGYLGGDAPPLRDPDGFVDTGDVLELDQGRYFFRGRRDGTINVGGSKVHPEEVEAVLNSHPEIRASLVRAKKSPFTGALVVADVVLQGPQTATLATDILQFCRRALPAWKVPVAISFVAALPMAPSGKLIRHA